MINLHKCKTCCLWVQILIGLSFFSCSPEMEFDVVHVLNPNKISPLTALIVVDSEENGEISTTINGEIPITNTFKKDTKKLEIELIGLYPNRENKIDITFTSDLKNTTKSIVIKTNEVPIGLPSIAINTLNKGKMEPGFHACDFHMANYGSFNSTPFIFDNQGAIRWYLDFSDLGKMAGPFQKLKNGDIIVGTRTNIFSYDMLGKMTQKIDLNPMYGIHHDLLEMPDGKILALVGKRNQGATINGKPMLTDNDFTILLDKGKPTVIKEWDHAEILDVNRADINTTRPNDWIHTNSIYFNPVDSSIILSGKNQGVIKHSWDNDLKWILAPHQNWGKAGRKGEGVNTKDFLLTAIDSNNEKYESAVQTGAKSADDFDFPWGQHASKILPNGNLILFDNGSPRNFVKGKSYSRVVEYELDEKNKTAKQVWQFGKERGTNLYSAIVSDVDHLAKTNNILMTSGYIMAEDGGQSAKIIEIDRDTDEVVFEATLTLKTLKGTKKPNWGQTDILYRSERMPLR